MIIIAIFIVLIGLISIGVPVIIAIATVGMGAFATEPNLVGTLFPQQMFAMIDSFSLLAMPFFILAGSLMSCGGISKKIVQFADAAVGHIRAGLGHSAVVSSMIFAGVSGSSTADTAAIGGILIPSMIERGYKPGFAASLVACAGTIGPIIPPSMTMIIYGSMTGVSIGGLFLGGFIPGVIIGLMLMGTTYAHSFLKDFPELRVITGKFNIKKLAKSTLKVWPALLAPVIILGGILTGVFTATEAGAVTILYAFLISFFLYKSIKLKDLPKIILDAAITTTMVVGIISVAGALGWVLNYLDFNEIVLNFIKATTDNRMIVLFMLLGIMLVLTMFVESLAILIIFVPVASYISKHFGFDQYQFGLLMVIATQIGATTPPVAVLLFVATSIAKTTYDQTIKYCLPFVLTLIAVLILVALVPPLASWLPNTFLGSK